jgi:hypothetical protein
MVNEVRVIDEARAELEAIPSREQEAIQTAIEKLELFGQNLGHPHSSQVKGTPLRELRPRAGRSPWRALYRQVGRSIFVVAAIGPEALHDPRRFRRAVSVAMERLEAFEDRESANG